MLSAAWSFSVRVPRHRTVRAHRFAAATGLVAAFTLAFGAPPGNADTAPPPGEPVTVTADPLPTWQTNGTVWTVEVIGNAVYVGGSFSAIRPPGASPGDPRELPRGNVAAFDAGTGEPLPFNPSVEANQGKEAVVDDLEASPDGRTLYIAGKFTKINGQSRPRLGSVSLATGQLTGLRHDIDSATETLAVTATTVYVGGTFTSVDGTPRQHLAAFDTATGGLTGWAPAADRRVMSMTLSPDRTLVIVGGKFNTLNGRPPHGLGAVHTDATGTSAPWETGLDYVNDSRHSWATDLVADAATGAVYVSAAGAGTFDGRLAVDPDGGLLRWIDRCSGGTETITLLGGVLYSGSHAHDCSTQPGGFPELENEGHQRLLAEPAVPDPATHDTPPILHWFPDTNAGADDGQGPRSMDNDGRRVWLGGDFTTVNGQPQQGLTRFGSLSVSDDVNPPEPIGAPTVTKAETGALAVTWKQTWDRDNHTLTYQVVRDGTTVVHTLSSPSDFWNLRTLTFTDTGLVPGSTHTYTVRATDHFGNTVQSPKSNAGQAR